MRKEHAEHIVRWAEYVRTHPDWKLKLKPFLDAQILMARKFYKQFSMTPEGRETLRLLRESRLSRDKIKFK